MNDLDFVDFVSSQKFIDIHQVPVKNYIFLWPIEIWRNLFYQIFLWKSFQKLLYFIFWNRNSNRNRISSSMFQYISQLECVPKACASINYLCLTEILSFAKIKTLSSKGCFSRCLVRATRKYNTGFSSVEVEQR